MSVFKIKKNENYTVMSNYHLRDKNLSYKAKGLLSFMLSLPDNWDYSLNGLVAVSKEQITSIRSTIDELKKQKYLKREISKDSKGKFKYNYLIYEIPYDKLPYIENLYTDDLYTENYIQINTNIININKDKIDKTIHQITNELINRNFINEDDLYLQDYNDLFKKLLKQYKYIQIIIACNYIIKHFNENEGLDKNYNLIQNKFYYFKESLSNNLKKLKNNLDLELDYDWEEA